MKNGENIETLKIKTKTFTIFSMTLDISSNNAQCHIILFTCYEKQSLLQ